jgi:hypothetical protein
MRANDSLLFICHHAIDADSQIRPIPELLDVQDILSLQAHQTNVHSHEATCFQLV